MTHVYIHTFEVAQFSKRVYLFTVKGYREEPSTAFGNPIYYNVLREKIGSGEVEVTQEKLSAAEIIRYLANAAEDGSLLYSEE